MELPKGHWSQGDHDGTALFFSYTHWFYCRRSFGDVVVSFPRLYRGSLPMTTLVEASFMACGGAGSVATQ
jgi:hypothetical protein